MVAFLVYPSMATVTTGTAQCVVSSKSSMKNFFTNLKEHLTKIVNCEKMEMLPLKKKEKKS